MFGAFLRQSSLGEIFVDSNDANEEDRVRETADESGGIIKHAFEVNSLRGSNFISDISRRILGWSAGTLSRS